MAETTFIASLAGITASKFGTGEAAIITSPADENFEYKHVQTDGATVITTITGENVPVGKIMFIKYRLNGGHYPEGSFSIHVKYKYNGAEKMAVGSGTDGAVLNYQLVKRHRGWVVGRVNAQGAMMRDPKPILWTNDNESLIAERITIEITHSDDLDIAYFITDHKDINLMPTVRECGDEYYMHQATEFGQYIDSQWRKIKDTNDGGITVLDSECIREGVYVAPAAYPPEYPLDPEPVFYTVSFELCGHGSEIKAQTVRGGKKVTMPLTPSTEEYRFVAWYTDPKYKTEFDFELPVTSDLALYAKWSEYEVFSRLSEIAKGVQDVYNAGIEKGMEEGKKSEYDLFWDTFQNNGSRTQYERVFAEAGSGVLWQVGTTYRPKYSIAPTRADDMYYATRLPYEALKEVDFSNCTSLRQTFAYASTLRLGVIDARKATNVNNAFAWTNKLQTIDKLIVADTTPCGGMFNSCTGLEKIIFEGTIAQNGLDMSSCTKLSQGSIESIIWCLSDTTQGLKITLSKAAVDKAYESSEGANDGSDSSIWLDDKLGYRPNWTIALV